MIAHVDMQEALVLAGETAKQSTKVGVYVGCMWAHEFVEVLPYLVRTTLLLFCGDGGCHATRPMSDC